MDTKNKRESDVRLEPETIREIEKDFAEKSINDFQTQFNVIEQQIAVLEKDKVGNKWLLEQLFAEKEKILKQINVQESN